MRRGDARLQDRKQILPLAVRSRPQVPQLRTADPGSEGTALPENTPALHGAETLDGTHRDAGKMVLPERVFRYAEGRRGSRILAVPMFALGSRFVCGMNLRQRSDIKAFLENSKSFRAQYS